MTDSKPKSIQSSPSSLSIITASPIFNSRDWLNISSPVGPNHEPQSPHNSTHRRAYNDISSLNIFSANNVSNPPLSGLALSVPNDQDTSTPCRNQISPRSDTLLTIFEFGSSSVHSTPTPGPISAANPHLTLDPIRDGQSSSSSSFSRGDIPMPVVTYPFSLQSSMLASREMAVRDPTTPKSKPNPALNPAAQTAHNTIYTPTSPEPEIAHGTTYPYADVDRHTSGTLTHPQLSIIQNQTLAPFYPSFSPLVPISDTTPVHAGPNMDFADSSRQDHLHINRFSFLHSDDWHLSGGVAPEASFAEVPSYPFEFGFTELGYTSGYGYGYVSPVSRHESGSAGDSYDADAFKVNGGSRMGRAIQSPMRRSQPDKMKNRKENTFMQKLISLSGRASSSPTSFVSPVAQERQDGASEADPQAREQAGRLSMVRLNFPEVSAFGHRSLSLPPQTESQSQPESHSGLRLQTYIYEDASSPLTSLSSSPTQPIIKNTQSQLPSKGLANATASCTPTPAAPRFTRKSHHLFQTPSQAHPPKLSLILTPSCADQAPALDRIHDDEELEDGVGVKGNVNVEHKYRTRSKLAGVRGCPELSLSEAKKVPLAQDSKKRKRRAEHEFEKSEKEMPRKMQKKTHRTKGSTNENDGESVYAPSTNMSPCSTRLSLSTSSASKSLPRINTKSQSKSKFQANPEPNLLTLQLTNAIPDLRTFPSNIPYHPTFPLYYRRFPAPFRVDAVSPSCSQPQIITGVDLYNPHLTRGLGATKMGLCPICMKGVDEGGEGKRVWLSLKFSAYKCYHMQYYHGISSRSHLPFSPPTSFRVSPRPNASKSKHEKSAMAEGSCHKCAKWVELEGVKVGDAKVKEIYWWKHAAKCHQGSNILGESDFLLDDD